MRRIIWSAVLGVLFAVNANAAIYVIQPDGTKTAKTTLAAAATAADAAGKTVEVTSAYTISADLTWPGDRVLRVTKSGLLTVNAALAIAGPFEAGRYRVFSVGSGTVTGLKEARPEWFGAFADNVASAALPKIMAASQVIKFGPGPYKFSVGSSWTDSKTLYFDNTVINHTGNDILFDFTASGLFDRTIYRGNLTINGNSGADAAGIRIAVSYRSVIDGVLIQNYTGTNSIALQLENVSSRWTEGTVIDNSHLRGNTVGLDLNVNGGTTSFAELNVLGLSVVPYRAGEIGVRIRGGANIYGGVWNLKGNIENATATFVRQEGNSYIADMLLYWLVEGTGNGIVQTAGSTIDTRGSYTKYGAGSVITDSASGNCAIGATAIAGASSSYLSRPAGTTASIWYQTDGVNRWRVGVNGDAETGINAGSNYAVMSRADDGTSLAIPLQIDRATGKITLLNAGVGIGRGPTSELDIYATSPTLTFTSTNNSSGVRYNLAGTANTPHRWQYAGTTQFGTTSAGNLYLGADSTFGTNATKTFKIENGVVPSTSPADSFQLYSADIAAGNAAPHFRTEDGAVVKLYQQAANANTSGATLTQLETEVNELKALLRNVGLMAP